MTCLASLWPGARNVELSDSVLAINVLERPLKDLYDAESSEDEAELPDPERRPATPDSSNGEDSGQEEDIGSQAVQKRTNKAVNIDIVSKGSKIGLDIPSDRAYLI